MTTATETAKIAVSKVIMTRAEGPVDECFTIEVPSLKAATRVLWGWSYSAPEPKAYDKIDVRVEYADRTFFDVRFDLSRGMSGVDNLLEDGIRGSLEYRAGLRCPEWLTEPVYEARIAGQRDAATRFLATYEV